MAEKSFTQDLRSLLGLLTEHRNGGISFTPHRERHRWRIDYEAVSVPVPPEARPQPMRRTDYPASTRSAVHTMAEQVMRLLQVPTNASAHLTLNVMMEDDRLTHWEPGAYQAMAGGRAHPTDSQAIETVSLSVLPFMRGLGPRTVRLELLGTHEGSSPTARWRVTRAETLHVEPAAAEVTDVLQEYRRLHADIFHRYREEMVDTVELAGTFTLEQVALSIIGGLIGKGLHVVFEAVAPTLFKMLARSGTETVRWFRTQLVRTGRKNQELLRRSWTKTETEGLESLSAAERGELTGILRDMEQALTRQLDPSELNRLRKSAREDYFQKFHKDFAQTLGKDLMRLDEVHHRSPMEFAHLFPMVDINNRANLVGVAKPVHQAINRMWNTFRPPRPAPRPRPNRSST